MHKVQSASRGSWPVPWTRPHASEGRGKALWIGQPDTLLLFQTACQTIERPTDMTQQSMYRCQMQPTDQQTIRPKERIKHLIEQKKPGGQNIDGTVGSADS